MINQQPTGRRRKVLSFVVAVLVAIGLIIGIRIWTSGGSG